MRVSIGIAAIAALAGWSSAVNASPAGAGRGLDEQVHAYVETVAVPGPAGPVLRFEKPVCPAAHGLPDKLNADITNRMRAVAAAAGARVQETGCHANLLLFVPKDRNQLFADLRRDRPELFGKLTSQQAKDLATSAEPAVAWQILQQRGADGRTLSGAWREGQPLVQEAVTNSRVTPSARSELDVAVVVLDTQAALGMTTTELADYALMRGLAQTRGDAQVSPPVPSILTIFRDKHSGHPAPLSVTEWDLAYLKALYGTANDAFGAAERGELETRMKRTLPQSSSAE
jgi:hypothetical protein